MPRTTIRSDDITAGLLPTAGNVTTVNTFFQNWNTIDTNTTSTFATTTNAGIIGPISVTGSFVWSMNGTLNII